MAAKKSSKKKSAAYRLVHEATGHHYIVRLGRDGHDKLKDKTVRKYNPKLKAHVEYKVKKVKKG